jgi:uncharacterized protein
MVNFWDTSAVVPLLIREEDSRERQAEFENTARMVVWWATYIEGVSALCRREREGNIDSQTFQAALNRLKALADQWITVSPSQLILSRSERMLRIHPLRAADAIQLAAAILASRDEPGDSTFHTADSRLAEAAEKEGFTVVPPRSDRPNLSS